MALPPTRDLGRTGPAAAGGGLPEGVLALGTRTEGTFHPQQGTELLSFLARVVEHAVRRWATADQSETA